MDFYALRKKAGMTQAETAKALGVTVSAVSQWESGDTNPSTAKLPVLAKLYGVTVDELLKEDE